MRGRAGVRAGQRAVLYAAAAATMAACTSVSLKPQARAPVVVSTPQAVVLSPGAASGAASDAASTAGWAAAWATAASAAVGGASSASATAMSQPVQDGALPEAMPLPATPPPPVSPAVAARFPEPDVSFATPAFEPERTAFTSNDELRGILRRLERNGDGPARGGDVTVLDLGVSLDGTPIQALAFTRLPAPAQPPSAPPAGIAPAPAPARRPAVILMSGQHGDGPAGTEALIVVAQDMAAGRYERMLSRVDVFVVPRVNPDAAALGRRGASDGSDIDHDHLLLRTPEAQALGKLVRDVDPVVVLDLQEYAVDGGFEAKFGAVQRFDALLDYATVANLPPFVSKAAEEWFRQPLAAGLQKAGFSNEWVYRVSADPADRTLAMGGVGPQLGRNANGLKNIVSLLVQTRGGGIGRGDLKRRVQADVVAVRSVLTSAAARGGDLLKLRDFVERDVAAQACRGGDAVVDAAPTPSEHVLTMLDPQTGAIKRATVGWDSALELRTLKSRPRPCGYWLAPGEFQAAQRLRLLGIEVQQLDEAGEMRGEVYRVSNVRPAAGADPAARSPLRVQTAPALLDVAAGGYYVSLAQPLANLAIAALEPDAPSSYAAEGLIPSIANEARVTSRPQMRMTALP